MESVRCYFGYVVIVELMMIGILTAGVSRE